MKGPAALLFVVLVIAAVAVTNGKKHFRHGTASSLGAITLSTDDAFDFLLNDKEEEYKGAWKDNIMVMLRMFKVLAKERNDAAGDAAKEEAFYKKMWGKLREANSGSGYMAMSTVKSLLSKNWYMEQLAESHTKQEENELFTNPLKNGLLEQWNLDPDYYELIQAGLGPVPQESVAKADDDKPDPKIETDKSYCVLLVEKYITDREYAAEKKKMKVEERLVAKRQYSDIKIRETLDVCSHNSFARNARVKEHKCCEPTKWNFDFWLFRHNDDIWRKMSFRRKRKLFYVLRFEPDYRPRVSGLWPYPDKRVEYADKHITDWQQLLPKKKAAMKKVLDDFERHVAAKEFGKRSYII